jgi:hypothetical protein
MSLHLHYIILLQFGGGFTKAIGQIKAMLKNFLWGGTKNTFKANMVRWSYCCAKKTIGGLGLTNLEEAIEAFLSKEVMTTLKPGEFNLKQLLKYKLERSKPFQHKTWTPNIDWAYFVNHQATH